MAQKTETRDLNAAARLRMEWRVPPYLEPFDPVQCQPYPQLVRGQMERGPIYRIRQTKHGLTQD